MTNQGIQARSLGRGESGMALISTLLVMMLISALVAGTYAAVIADQRASAAGRDQTAVYAGAHAGLEKLTSDLATLFATDVSPSLSDVQALTTAPPTITDLAYKAPVNTSAGQVCYGSGYQICFDDDGHGNPMATAGEIAAGPYQGFYGLITPYTITVTTATTKGGAEVRLRRTLQTVAVPAFQFGVFSDSDLTFYAGDNFDFGGRVHTNGHLFLSELAGFTLKFTDRITAFRDVIRAYLSNGKAVSSVGFTGTVSVPTSIGNPGTYRPLATTEGSVVGMPGSTVNTGWKKLSIEDYVGNIRDGDTGAQKLELPLVSQGAEPIDLIRRPPLNSNEHLSNKPVFDQRYYSMASLRILLSDRAADITGLPTVTGAAPVLLDGTFAGLPMARSIGNFSFQTHSSTDSTYSAGLATIMVNDVPAQLEMPLLTVGALTNVLCLGRTSNQFVRCNLSANVAAGTLITGVVNGTTVTAVTSSATSSGGSQTLNLTGSTALFAPRLFNQLWATDSTGTTPIWCTGYEDWAAPPRLTGCSGLSGAPARGSWISTQAHVPADTPLIGGFIKIEKQSSAGTWSDVTAEILALGVGAPNQDAPTVCADPTPNAVLRIQRLRDNGGGGCTYAASTSPYDWWPNTLYDAREANYRDVGLTAPIVMGGVMHYVSIDVNNLKRWFAGTIGTTGSMAWNNNGYIVYFSDRRGNHNWNVAGLPETGEYGWEDVVNPSSPTGDPDGQLQEGEDVNRSNAVDTYGASPQALVTGAATSPFDTTGTQLHPLRQINAGEARVNRTVLFRRALKLVNGGIVAGVNSLPTSGLTIASENPVYVQGNYNATMSLTLPDEEPNVPAAVVADAVSVLSNNWRDSRSFRYPNNRDQRDATTTGFRFAVIAGKNPSFTYPSPGSPQFLFGTDGGAGNFLRLLENWNITGVSINYRGSIISLYYSRQATGTFKFNSNVYNYGDRNFAFDVDFLEPTLLPPGTPMFRDINTLTFRQILRPNQ